ncbi:uncharacterized protein LOC130301433 [Hyla sarda]|uniref:uncharacterized protein LOC130301433 n=1 Tax=Hyla sarda TaxID=327740 RepID=UPI0024C2EB89|nr:uncharacterized protein LOC130301433 [Hyla sarda]
MANEQTVKDMESINAQPMDSNSMQSMVDLSVRNAMASIPEIVAQSMALFMSHDKYQQPPKAGPSTPSDHFWSAEDSTSNLARGWGKSGKATHKRPMPTTGPSKSYKKPKVVKDQVPSSAVTKSRHTDAKKSHPIPSTREEKHDNRVKRVSRREKPDSYNTSPDQSSSEEGEISEYASDSEYEDISDNEEPTMAIEDPKAVIMDSAGIPYFDPSLLKHPRSGEWDPHPQVTQFLTLWVRKPIDRATRNRLRAECPRPNIPKKLSITPEIDPPLIKYLNKSGKNPKKGIDRSFKTIQDRFLDLLGPLTKILDLTEEASSSGNPVNLEVLKGWAQRALCIFGGINTTICTERKRSILLKLDPQLINLATTEPESSTEGLLFGDTFIKEINKYVALFSSLDKAQTSLKKVFQPRVLPRAGKRRGNFPSRQSQERQYTRAPQRTDRFQNPTSTYQSSPFFPTRGRPWRARGHRGYPRSRPNAV